VNELRAGAPLHARGFTIVPLERLRITVGCHEGRLFANASKHPAGVVVIGPRRSWAVDEVGRELDLDELADRVIGLGEIL